MDDKEIIKIYNDNNQKIKYSKEVKEYLKNRFNDSLSLSESAYRIINKLYIRPVCKICGNSVSYWGFTKDKSKAGFSKYCCDKCAKIGEKQTNIERYGYDHPWKNKEIREKIKNTCIEKYGYENPFSVPEFQEKLKNTCNKNYGVNYPLQNKKLQEKCKNTNIEKYGGIAPACSNNVKDKMKNTFNKKYGVNTPMELKEFKVKQFVNMVNNGNYGQKISKKEQYIADELKKKYPKLIQQYYSDEYPFECDIYIPEINTYIEYNGYWTHGYHPYNENNIDDINLVNYWKSKFTEKYASAINTFTIRDPYKRKIAKQNNLNYIEIWPSDNINEIIKNL